MKKSFEEICQTLHPFSEAQLVELNNKITRSNLKANSFIHQPGETVQALYFIFSGSIRQWIDSPNGEHTLALFVEGDWVTNLESLLEQKAAKSYLQTHENTQLGTLKLDDLHTLMDRDNAFKKLISILGLINGQQNEYTKNLLTPDDRYRLLIEQRPEVLQRFTLKQIASYLGMTPETLSRVRARIR